MLKPWFVLVTASLVGCATEPDEESIDCEAEGRCDVPDSQVVATPCDGIMVDMTGTNHQKVAGRLKDPVANLVFRTGDTCPTTFKEIMAKLRETDKTNCEGERDGIETRLVSETAQASAKATNYRAVTTRTCGDRETHEVMFSLFGLRAGQTELPPNVEIIAFDKTAGVFNYYETDGEKINFFGNSKDMLKGKGEGDVRRCASCHTGGGLIMKELDTPWLHWEGHMDTPGTDELVAQFPDLGSENSGAELEGVVKNGNDQWNTAKLRGLKRSSGGKVKTKELLRPLFCTVEVNLDNGADFESPVKGGTGGDQVSEIPFDSLFDPQLKAFGGIAIEFADYDAVIKANGQQVNGVTGAIDTVFDYVFLERSHADNDFVEKLVAASIIDAAFVKDALIVDFTRPIFSDDRCALLEFAPEVTTTISAKKVREGFIKNLEAARPAAGTPAATFLANLKASDDAAAHDAKVDAFVTACEGLGSRKLVENALKITSLNRNLGREMPVFEFESTMPTDNLRTAPGSRLHPKTCELTTTFVAP